MRSRFVFAASLSLLCLPVFAWADTPDSSLPDALGLQGSIRTGFYSASAKLDGQKDLGTGSLSLKAAPSFDNGDSMVLEAWLENDDSFRSHASEALMREAYVNLGGGDVDFRLGKQIIVWGRADRLNPTDNLTPRNYTWLTPDDDQRIGAPAAKMTYRLSDFTLTGIWLAHFSPNVIPIAPVAGTYFSERSPQTAQGAVKLDRSGGSVDWSLSIFDGLDLNPDMQIGPVGPAGLDLMLTHHRIKVLGADAATVVGRYGLRAEAAYTWTENTGPNDPLVKKPFFYFVAGGDRSFFDSFNINIQYYLRQVSQYRDPRLITDPLVRSVAITDAIYNNQMDRFQQGVTVRLNNKWMNDTLDGEVLGQISMTHRDYALRARLTYAFDDRLKGSVGANLYRGAEDTFFNEIRDISAVFAELKYSF